MGALGVDPHVAGAVGVGLGGEDEQGLRGLFATKGDREGGGGFRASGSGGSVDGVGGVDDGDDLRGVGGRIEYGPRCLVIALDEVRHRDFGAYFALREGSHRNGFIAGARAEPDAGPGLGEVRELAALGGNEDELAAVGGGGVANDGVFHAEGEDVVTFLKIIGDDDDDVAASDVDGVGGEGLGAEYGLDGPAGGAVGGGAAEVEVRGADDLAGQLLGEVVLLVGVEGRAQDGDGLRAVLFDDGAELLRG